MKFVVVLHMDDGQRFGVTVPDPSCRLIASHRSARHEGTPMNARP